jgi:hypothetical protein
MGRLIRHAFFLGAAAKTTLAILVIEPAVRALLVAAIGGAVPTTAAQATTAKAAIALAAITAGT